MRRRRIEVPLRGLRRRARPLDVAVAAERGGTYVGIRNVAVVRCGAPDPVARRRV